jgi:hypothetical protein
MEQKQDIEEKEPGEKAPPPPNPRGIAISSESLSYSAPDFQRYSPSEFGNDILDLLLDRPSEFACPGNSMSPKSSFRYSPDPGILPSIEDTGNFSGIDDSNCTSEDEVGLLWPCEPLGNSSLDDSWLQ